jgi:competence protein ComGC
MNIRNCKAAEKGATLIELLVVIAILGAIIGVLSMTIITVMKVSPRSNNWAIALRQVQNAGYWISNDITMANAGTIAINAQFLPTLQLDEWNGNSFVTHAVEYVFDGQTLRRRLDGAPPGLLIAEYIDTGATRFEMLPGASYKFTVRAAFNDTSVTRTYETSPRLSSN